MIRELVRRLIYWACPELSTIPTGQRYYFVDDGRLTRGGQFMEPLHWLDIPDQMMILDRYRQNLVTYYRRRGSINPVIYERMEPA